MLESRGKIYVQKEKKVGITARSLLHIKLIMKILLVYHHLYFSMALQFAKSSSEHISANVSLFYCTHAPNPPKIHASLVTNQNIFAEDEGLIHYNTDVD